MQRLNKLLYFEKHGKLSTSRLFRRAELDFEVPDLGGQVFNSPLYKTGMPKSQPLPPPPHECNP